MLRPTLSPRCCASDMAKSERANQKPPAPILYFNWGGGRYNFPVPSDIPPAASSSPLPPKAGFSTPADLTYTPPAEVFQYWYNKALQTFPGERPPLEWLSQKSRLPVATCAWYRKRYEAAFPNAALLVQCGRRLRLPTKRAKNRTPKPGP